MCPVTRPLYAPFIPPTKSNRGSTVLDQVWCAGNTMPIMVLAYQVLPRASYNNFFQVTLYQVVPCAYFTKSVLTYDPYLKSYRVLLCFVFSRAPPPPPPYQILPPDPSNSYVGGGEQRWRRRCWRQRHLYDAQGGGNSLPVRHVCVLSLGIFSLLHSNNKNYDIIYLHNQKRRYDRIEQGMCVMY